jgi:hypothetical protein
VYPGVRKGSEVMRPGAPHKSSLEAPSSRACQRCGYAAASLQTMDTVSDDGKAASQALDKVVLLFAVYPSQIRDGPMRRRLWLVGLLTDDCETA